MVFQGNAGANTGEHTDGEEPPPDKPGAPAPPPAQTVATALAEANKAFEDAQAALRKGDLKGYADAVAKAQAAVNRAAQAQGRAQPNPPAGGDNAPTPTPTPTSTPTPTPSRSPSTAARSG
jgi:hypothetical protein